MPNDAQAAIESDIVIIGDGVIGLSTALELGRAGARAHVVGVRRDGAASGAAAGLLAPSIGQLEPHVREVFEASLARYPAFVDSLRAFDPELKLLEGLLQISRTSLSPAGDSTSRLDRDDIARLEPAIAVTDGGLMHARDAAIDNVRLMSALERAVEHERGITVTRDDPAVAVGFGPTRVRVETRAGRIITGRVVVLAAGAWSSGIEGLPRALPVTPLKGQMLAVRSTSLRRSIAGDDVYLVPRGDEIVIGATVEEAGFDLSIDETAIEGLRSKAIELCPVLADAPVVRRWAGIRPATPDRLPIIGPDPFERALIYACGHSKNGILLAPETAAIVARLALGDAPGRDISRFSVTRFMQSRIE